MLEEAVRDNVQRPKETLAGRKRTLAELPDHRSAVEELQLAQEALRESQDRLNAIIHSAMDAILTVDEDQRIVLFNAAAEKMFGCSAKDTIGQSMERFVPQRFHATHTEQVRQFGDYGATKRTMGHRGAMWAVRSSGAEFPIEASISKVETGGRKLFTVILRDITERKRAERTLRSLTACNESLMRATDEASLLKRICDLVVNVGGYRMAWVGYAEHDEKKTVRAVAESGFEAGYLDTVNITWADEERGRGPTGTAIRTGKAAACRDIASDPRFAPWSKHAAARGYRSSLVLPLKSGEQVLGAISIYATEAEAFDAAEHGLLEELSNNLSFGISALRARAERKLAEEARHESERRYRLLFSEMVVGFALLEVIYDENGKPCDERYLEVNPAFETHTGLARHRVLGRTIREVLPGIEPFWIETYGKVATTGESVHFQNYAQPLQKWFEVTAFRTHQNHLAVTFADVTERTLAEEARERLAAVVDSSDDAIISKTLDGTITAWNRGAEKVFGYSASEAVGKPMLMLTPPDRVDEEYDILGRIGRGESVEHFETIRIRKDRKCIGVSVTISPIRDSSGAIVGASKVARDITARKQAEKLLAEQAEELSRQTEELVRSQRALQAQTEMLQSVLNSMAEGLIVSDSQGKFILSNPAAERIAGQGPVDTPLEERPARWGLYLSDGVTPFPPEQLPLAHALRGETSEVAMVVRNPKLGNRWVNANGQPLRNEDGVVWGGMVTFRDVTEAETAERERRQAAGDLAKKAAELARSNAELEQFAYIASHDLQEPLRMVTAYTQLLGERYRGQLDEHADKFIGYATEGALRMQVLIQDLLAFSRVGRNEAAYGSLDCNAVMEEVLQTLSPAMRESGARVNSDELPTVWADRTQLAQVFQNLIGNAIKFRGKEPPVVSVRAEKAGDHWLFSVTDNGIGIAPEYAENIFVVFQRLHTRSEYPGNGIGLAICKKIVERGGGKIWVESRAGSGATFKFTVPLHSSGEGSDEGSDEQEGARNEIGTVLAGGG
jgi:PAS domain S-box-containing protein